MNKIVPDPPRVTRDREASGTHKAHDVAAWATSQS